MVNQFAGTPQSGWGERHFYLAKGWIQEGYKVVIISSGRNHMFKQSADMKGLYTLENYEGVDFLWIKIPKYNPKNISRFFAMIMFSLALVGLIIKPKSIGNPDYILHSSMSIFPAPITYCLKKILGAEKFIFEVRDLWPLTPIMLMGYSPKHLFIRFIAWIEKFAYRKSDAIVSALNGAEVYINKISKDPEKYNHIPNGFDEKLLQKKSQKPILSNQIPAGKIVIGYAGTIGFANALGPLFKAIQKLDDLKEKVFFVILGDGYLKADYQQQVSNCKNILFIPKVPKEEVQSYIDSFDICFISWHKSELYTYGVSANKYFDYMAAGKPILVAQRKIIDPVLLSGCGLIVENDETAIIDGVHQLLNLSESERSEMGQKGKEYALKHHSYELLSKKYLQILNDCAKIEDVAI